MNKTKLIERLQLGREFTESAFADLSNAEKNMIGTMEHWAHKDVLAHITSWQQRWLQWLEPIARREEPDVSGPGAAVSDENAANAETFASNQYHSWGEISQESKNVFDRALALVNLLSEEEVTNPQRFPGLKGRPLWKAVSGNFYWHVQVHLGNMYIERGQFERGRQIVQAFAEQVGADEPASERGEMLYNLACYFSLTGLGSEAMGHLKTALALNPALIEWSKKDTDLDPLRANPDFQAIYQALGADASRT